MDRRFLVSFPFSPDKVDTRLCYFHDGRVEKQRICILEENGAERKIHFYQGGGRLIAVALKHIGKLNKPAYRRNKTDVDEVGR